MRLSEVLHVRGPRELFVKEQFFVLSRGTTVMYFMARIFAIRVKEYHTSFFNRLLPSSKNPHFQNKVKCTFLVKMSFICTTMKNHFRIKGWALTLVLIQRPGELGTAYSYFSPLQSLKETKQPTRKYCKKDTAYIVEKHSVFQPAVITDLVEEFIKSCFLSWPTILQKNDHVTYEGVITSFCRQPLLKKEEEKKSWCRFLCCRRYCC